MHTGLDKVAAGYVPALTGRRIALLTHHAAVDNHARHAVDVLSAVDGLTIVRLLAPEHGLWGTHQDMEPVARGGGYIDPVFGLETRSLYGRDEASLVLDPGALDGCDALVVDLQDIGARYYTYAATLALALDAAVAADVEVFVLDRPNPLGPFIAGPTLKPGFESFVGLTPGLPIQHGLTIGGLARFYATKRTPAALDRLTVVGVDERGRPTLWVPPSPNMPTLETALIYPGMCLLEGTQLSEGRGTTTPFQLFGAPGIDPRALARELFKRELPGVDYVPRVFRPEFGKHAGERCGGVYLNIWDRSCVQGVTLGVHVLDALRTVMGAIPWRTEPYEFVSDRPAIDLLWGSPALRETLDGGKPIAPLLAEARAEAKAFAEHAQRYRVLPSLELR